MLYHSYPPFVSSLRFEPAFQACVLSPPSSPPTKPAYRACISNLRIKPANQGFDIVAGYEIRKKLATLRFNTKMSFEDCTSSLYIQQCGVALQRAWRLHIETLSVMLRSLPQSPSWKLVKRAVIIVILTIMSADIVLQRYSQLDRDLLIGTQLGSTKGRILSSTSPKAVVNTLPSSSERKTSGTTASMI